MTPIFLEVRASGGKEAINDIAKAMCALATITGIVVRCQIGGVGLFVKPATPVERVVAAFMRNEAAAVVEPVLYP